MQFEKLTLWDYMKFLIPLRHWVRNDPYSKEADDFINLAAEKDLIVYDPKSAHHAFKIGMHELWTANYPYAYGTIENRNGYEKPFGRVLPSRLTVIKLRKLQKKLEAQHRPRVEEFLERSIKEANKRYKTNQS